MQVIRGRIDTRDMRVRTWSATSAATSGALPDTRAAASPRMMGCLGLTSSTCGGRSIAALPALLWSTMAIMRRRAPLSWSVMMAGEPDSRCVTRTSRTRLSPSVCLSQPHTCIVYR